MSSLRLATASNVRAFQNLTAALSTGDRKWAHAIDQEALEDEIGRFRVWAGNLGALQKGHSSLDYRLRDSPVSNTNTLKLLKELETNINEAYAVVSGARLPYEEQPRPNMTEDDDDDDGFFSAEEDDEDSSCDEPRSELKMRFAEIVDIIDNLYKLSVRIRTPGLRSRSLRASSYTQKDPETGIDIFDMYAVQDLKHVHELVSHLRQPYVGDDRQEEPDSLTKRLSASVTLRRRHFKYWKRHRDKLSASAMHDDVQGPDVTTPLEGPAPTSNDDPQVVSAPMATVSKEAPSQKTGKTLLSGTEVTQLHMSIDDIVDAKSVTSYAVTVRDMDGKGIDLPPPPKSTDPDKDFECPYCWVVCPARYGKGRAWRTHLLQDLQPYSCTYPECESSHMLFRSRREWAEHEASHRKVWRCPEHPDAVFPSQSGLEHHLRQMHLDSFPESQLVTITKVGEATTIDTRGQCPICRVPTDTEGLGDLQSHIANHLERIATFALPHGMEEDSDGASSIAGPGSTSSKSLLGSVSIDEESWQDKRKERDDDVTLQLDHYKSAGVADSSRGLLSAESLQQLPDASKNILDVISNQLNNPNSSYNQDIAHTSGEKRILQINEIPTLRSLYRSRQLLQLDQSYAPNDSYNRMISFCNHDLTKLEVDAIVNNAPLDLRHSPNRGTLHQAIMEAGGPNLVQEARSKPKFKLGQVELTHGHGLPSSWIFHAAVPTFAGKGAVVQYSTLGNCYRNALDKAADLGIRTIAFPCLGTGGCGFSPRQAARTALQAVREDLDARSENKFERIVFCVKSAVDEKAYMDFFPVFFPPTHGDLDMARKSNRPARYAVLASRVMDTRVQVQKSTAALSSEFGGVVPEIENDYISLLAEIDSALASIHHALLGPENLEEHSDDLNLLCFVLSTLSTSITKMVATAERKARTGATHREILEVTDWSMNGKYGSDLKQFLLHCSSFANGLNHVMMRKKTVWDITKMRSRMESYRAKEIRRDAEDVSDQPDEATSAQHSIPTASSDRNLVNPHQIPSVARLYQLGAIKAKHTLARPSTAFNRIVCLAREDMTKLEVDVIVNSTDTSFLGMGTLDRTIFKKGGSDLQEEVQKFGECREGDVKTTPGYLLPAKHIVHVIPPKVFKKDNKNMLRNIYREILHTATFLEAKSVAIPCIGTGTLNYPLRDTASLAMEEVRRFLQSQEQGSLEKIIFAVYSSHDEDTYKSLLPVYFPPPEESVSKSLDSRTRRGPERPSIWRWVCCSCGGDNSYKTDKVCSGCHNHWRDSRCKLYDANIRDSETVDTSPSGSILNTGNSQSNAPEDPSRSMPVHDSPAMIKAKVSILNGLEATPEPVHKDWCIVHVLGSSVNVYKKSESSKDPYLVLSLDLVLDTTWPRRTALLGVTIKNVQITSEPPGDKVTVYFQCENSEDKTVLYSALFAAVTHVRQQQNIERRKDQEVADEQESDLDLVSTAEKREDVTNTRDDAHSPDVESQVHDEQHGNDMVPPGDQQSQDSDSIATPGSEHNDASRDSVSNPEESHQGYQTDGLEEEDDDEDINRERRRQRRLERQRRKEGIENVKREGRYPPYLYMIINHLTEDLHQRPASYIGQHIDSISSALDIDTTTLSAHLRVLAAQGKVHTTVDDETWVVSGYENTMVPPLPEERDENRVG